MSTILRITAAEYDSMIAKGAFDGIDRRIELIHGELREMNPAGPVHGDFIDYLTRWSTDSTTSADCVVRVQSGIDLDDSRPEPDLVWLKPGRYAARHPQSSDVLLLIEVADSSVQYDMGEKAALYAQWKIAEYWVVDAPDRCIHVFADGQEAGYQTTRRVEIGEKLSPQCKPEAMLDLAELFI
jgi:Uma2 family endonuclease